MLYPRLLVDRDEAETNLPVSPTRFCTTRRRVPIDNEATSIDAGANMAFEDYIRHRP